MGDLLFWHRLQFGFTATFHYLFPQLTMGLALVILLLKGLGLAKGDERFDTAARFWIRIFGLSFAVGVVTGIPLEFQFGTNWARFSTHAGGVIGQTLGMEGMFAFFLESACWCGANASWAGSGTSWRPWRCSSAAGPPATSSSPPTPSCSIRWAT